MPPASFEAVGLTMKDFYMVTGRYDMIEAPDEGAAASAPIGKVEGEHHLRDLQERSTIAIEGHVK